MALAPVAEGRWRDAGEVLDVVGDLADSACTEHLVEVLHGSSQLDRGTALDGLLRGLLGVMATNSMVRPRTSERIPTCSRTVSATGPLRM